MIKGKNRTLPIAVCAAVVLNHGKVLLTQRPADKKLGGYWEFPGGKVDHRESPHHALIRELREELDIEIEVGPILETVYHRYEWGQVLILAYQCFWKSGNIKHLEVEDHSWVAPKDLHGYNILPADQPIIEKLQTLNSTGSI
ncbi:MAG: (deoxy)nucleoside triphosphate pyrophosphohydrolase [Desulfofustis sp.]|nr:(deoxy)nucleoside triphosphate pyrophosphohydrolase [Desulfofustis sp.]